MEMNVAYLEGEMIPPKNSERTFSESVQITQPERLPELIRYYRATYDFSSPKRYKTVLHLEPRLAPVRYYRTINFCISPLLRHKSLVECDYRHRPRSVSETAWVFPKQAQELFTSVAEYQLLVDTRWYKQHINISDNSNSEKASLRNGSISNGAVTQGSYDSSSPFPISDEEDEDQSLINNNYKPTDKAYPYSIPDGSYSAYDSDITSALKQDSGYSY